MTADPDRGGEGDALRRREAEDALARAEADSEVFGTSRLAAGLRRARDHLGAADAEGDSVEMWGTRIGRLLGAIAFVGLAVYLLATYILR